MATGNRERFGGSQSGRFTCQSEFPRLRFHRRTRTSSTAEAAEKEGLTILWIPLSHSAYKETKIGEYQAASGCSPDHPISSLPGPEQDRVFVAICEEIKALMNA